MHVTAHTHRHTQHGTMNHYIWSITYHVHVTENEEHIPFHGTPEWSFYLWEKPQSARYKGTEVSLSGTLVGKTALVAGMKIKVLCVLYVW